jgi:hypothetical protein
MSANEEYADTQILYCFCNGSGRATVVEYWQRFPHHKTLENVQRTLRETSSFPWANAECEQQWYGGVDVLAAVQWSRISRMTGVAQTQVWRILHSDGFYPYHRHRKHLVMWDHADNVWFCEWLQPHLHILHDILFTDEAQFMWGSITSARSSLSWTQKKIHMR